MELPMKDCAYRVPRACNRKLLISCATLALATGALAPQKARAQAPNRRASGDDHSSTNASQNITTPGIAETITITNSDRDDQLGANATTPRRHAFRHDRLPAFRQRPPPSQGGPAFPTIRYSTGSFRPRAGADQLNGTVLAKLAGGSTGGNVWFYSPGGIVVGAKAHIRRRRACC